MEYDFRFGYQDNLNHAEPIIDDVEKRFKHTYIIGKTGMGKSTLLERMAQYDISKGFATIVIDPKGDSVRKIYHLVQDKSKIRYVSIDHPMVINPLGKKGYKLSSITQELIQTIDSLIRLTSSNPETTVLMREIITASVKIIAKSKQRDIDSLVDFLLYKDVRDKIINMLDIKSQEYKYWKEFDAIKDKYKERLDCAKRVASRLIEISRGEMSDFVRGENELNIAEIIQNEQVLLVDTSRMNRNSRIYLSNLIIYAIVSYCSFEINKDKPLLVYCDEFQIVVSELFAEMLATSRGSNVGFTLSQQTFSQIPKNILNTIFGTVDTTICFRCGDEEARRFADIFRVKNYEILDLPNYHAWIRLGTDNILVETYPPQISNVPKIELPQKDVQSEIQFTDKEINMLEEVWISF